MWTLIRENLLHTLPVVFEDAGWRGLRPLADSTPTFEIRCGLFNLRERIDLVRDRRGQRSGTGIDNSGTLLMRPVLRDLSTAATWSCGGDSAAPSNNQQDRYAWLNGRLGLCNTLLDLVFASDKPEREFAVLCADTLVAGVVGPPRHERLHAAWSTWCDGGAGASGLDLTAGALWSDLERSDLPGAWILLGGDADLRACLQEILGAGPAPLFDWIWQIVPATATALGRDLDLYRKAGAFHREPFGLVWADATAVSPWAEAMDLRAADAGDATAPGDGVTVTDARDLWLGCDVNIAPGVVIDTGPGPVILDNHVRVMPHSYLEGPLYVGPGSRIKAGAKIYGESAFGIGCRVTGEIGESTFGDFTNKQHDGFIGHAVLGSWVNLGALTTNSDLKNNYGNVRIDLGEGAVETGLRFVGLMAGDHVKTAIGTMFNTGTVVGFASNIFGGMPPKYVGAYSWGGQADAPVYGLDQAMATAEVVLGRRGCRFTEAHAALFTALAH